VNWSARFTILLGTLLIAALAILPASHLEPGQAQEKARVTKVTRTKITFELGDIEAVRDAAEYATQCGGKLELWSDLNINVVDCTW
jgi:predicted outer membrane lipoprotein